jgi:hypothetical protein
MLLPCDTFVALLKELECPTAAPFLCDQNKPYVNLIGTDKR